MTSGYPPPPNYTVEQRAAVLSQDGLYRFFLERHLSIEGERASGAPRTMAFVMLNPSTADANKDDATIRKCMGFAVRARISHVQVVNLFAWRATNPKDLVAARKNGRDIVGTENDNYIAQVRDAEYVICAWGVLPASLAPRAREVLNLFTPAHRVGHLGNLTQDGGPRHPLYLPYDSAPFRKWAYDPGTDGRSPPRPSGPF